MFVSATDAAKHYGVSRQTVSRWSANGRIEFLSTPSGQKRYKIGHDAEADTENSSGGACYCRVSHASEKELLERQISFLKCLHPGWTVFADTGSGHAWLRPGFQKLLKACFEKTVTRVAVIRAEHLATSPCLAPVKTMFTHLRVELIEHRHGPAQPATDGETLRGLLTTLRSMCRQYESSSI